MEKTFTLSLRLGQTTNTPLWRLDEAGKGQVMGSRQGILDYLDFLMEELETESTKGT
jgi:hypothetical protein